MQAQPVEILEALWKLLKDYYPMMEYMGAHGDAWLEEFRPRVADASTPDEAYDLIDEMLCRLRDYHTWFARPGRQWRFEGSVSPPIRAAVVVAERKKVVAVVEKFADCPLSVGDEILAVDGQPIETLLQNRRKYAVGSTEGALLRSICWQILLGPSDQPLQLTIRSAPKATPRQVIVRRDTPRTPTPIVSCREVEGVPILRITSWNAPDNYDIAAEFDRLLEPYRTHPHLIIDVRGNGGGQDHVADKVTGRFLRQRVISSIFFLRKPPEHLYERHIWHAEPHGPWRFEGRYAVLIDEGCMSACEHFTSGMLAGGACLVGSTTNGACGGTQILPLPGGARCCISRAFDFHGTDPSARHGILPHITAPLRLDALRAGRDGAIDAAITWLRSGRRLPSHSQRLEPTAF